jgi:hypothetical protein
MMEEASTSKASVITYDFLLLFKKLASGHTWELFYYNI